MSTLYISKCKKICEAENVLKVDISDKESVKSAISDPIPKTVLLGQRCPSFYKANKSFARVIDENLSQLLLYTKSNNIKLYMLLQDTHPKTYRSLDTLTNFINKEKIDLIFTFYENGESRFIRKACINSKFYHLPHHIDTKIFHPLNNNDEKVYDILLYGDIHPTHYPFRKRLFELITKEADNYNLKVLYISPPVDPKTQGKVFDPDKCESGLAAKIRSAKYAIATKSKYDYLVAKYFEIAACETSIIGDMAADALKMPLFNDNYIKLNNKMTDSEIMECISNAVKTYDVNSVSKNRKSFALYILDNYNLDVYLKKLLQILN